MSIIIYSFYFNIFLTNFKVIFQTKNWAIRLASPINDIEMWKMTDPNVKRLRLLCDAKCNMVGNVYM